MSREHLLLFLLVSASLVVNIWCQPAPSPDNDDDNDKDDDPFQEKWTWCVEDEDEMDLCESMCKILDEIDPEKEHSHTCISGEGDAEACMKKMSTGEAKLGIFDGGEILKAFETYALKAIRTENNQLESSYYGVGIVKSDKCPKKLSDLRGKRTCHTGYGRSAGWVLPVTYFIDKKIMPLVNRDPQVSNDIESVKSFFSKSCAANNDPQKSICTACKEPVGCTEDDEYYDYAGAFRCLVEGSGDIAFTKHSIPGLYVKGGSLEDGNWTNLQDADAYQILCPGAPDGKMCESISNYKKCNFGVAPGHTIMVWGNFSDQEIKEFNAVMDAANNNAAFKDLFSKENLLANEFAAGVSASIPYNGSVVNLLGPLYTNTQDLQAINNARQTMNSAYSLFPGSRMTMMLVAMALAM